MLGRSENRQVDTQCAPAPWWHAIVLCILMLGGAVQAQTELQSPPAEPALQPLPDSEDWLRRVAHAEPAAVLGTIALARLLESLDAAPDADMQTVIGRVSTDMSRLRALAEHYPHLPIVLQPAGVDMVDAITVAELEQQGLELWLAELQPVEQRMAILASDTLLAGSDDAAAGWLATALRHFYPRSGQVWAALKELEARQPDLVRAAVAQLDLEAGDDAIAAGEDEMDDLERLIQAAEAGQPITETAVAGVRLGLLEAAMENTDDLRSLQRRLVMTELAAASGRSLERLLGLLNLESRFALYPEASAADDEALYQRLKAWLLPVLITELSILDPELIPVLVRLQGDEPMQVSSVLDARTLLHLGVEDASFYLSQPVRNELAEEIDICLSIAGNFSADTIIADLEERSIALDGNARMRMVPGQLRLPSGM